MTLAAQLIERALSEADSQTALLDVARAWKDQGFSQPQIYAVFEQAAAQHAADSDEQKYDMLLDVMDRIVGYGPAHHHLFGSTPT